MIPDLRCAGLPHRVGQRGRLGDPGPIVLVLVVAGALAFLLNRITWGRSIVAIGGSQDAAEKVGIPVRKVLFSVFVLASLFASVAGLLVAGRNDAGTVDDGSRCSSPLLRW